MTELYKIILKIRLILAVVNLVQILMQVQIAKLELEKLKKDMIFNSQK